MCPARFFEVCEGDFSICVSSQKTKHSYTHTTQTPTHRTKLKTTKKRHRSSSLTTAQPAEVRTDTF